MKHSRTISVTGLGYVGLPVAVAFAYSGGAVIGFDIDAGRVAQLRDGVDLTCEVEPADLRQPALTYTTDAADLQKADFHIVTVPTPIDDKRHPDLGAMLAASRTVGGALKKGDIVVYESTVYPGAVEEDCVPVLEAASGLKADADFTVGYSPERINPGDKQHRFETMKAGYRPEVILAGRHINDSMGAQIARECLARLKGRAAGGALVTLLGLTFKDDVPDTRNSKVIDIVRTLEQGGATVQLHDSLATPEQAREEYRVELMPMESLKPADAVIFAVAHEAYISGGWPLAQILLKGGAGVVLDVKCRLDRSAKPEGIDLWRL